MTSIIAKVVNHNITHETHVQWSVSLLMANGHIFLPTKASMDMHGLNNKHPYHTQRTYILLGFHDSEVIDCPDIYIVFNSVLSQSTVRGKEMITNILWAQHSYRELHSLKNYSMCSMLPNSFHWDLEHLCLKFTTFTMGIIGLMITLVTSKWIILLH